MYAVVEFDESLDDGGLAIVSCNWLTPRKKEPPYKDNLQYTKAVKRHEQVDKENWKLYAVKKIYYESGDYEKTLKKLKVAEISSDIQPSDDFDLQKKRQRKKPRRLILEESSDEELGQRHLPRPPSVKYSRIINSTICRTPIVDKVASQTSTYGNSSSTPQSIDRTYLSPSVTNVDKPAHEAILTYVIQIKEQNKQILSLLKNLQSGIPEYCHLPADLPVTLPINNLQQDIQCLEEYLSTSGNLSALLAFFTSKGVKGNVVSSTNIIMRHLMSDEIAVNFSFFGNRLGKRAFNYSVLKDVIIGSVKACCPPSKDKEIEDALKMWLKHAPQRLKNKQRVTF
nr:unnamed protein product [Callosobruchus analis]